MQGRPAGATRAGTGGWRCGVRTWCVEVEILVADHVQVACRSGLSGGGRSLDSFSCYDQTMSQPARRRATYEDLLRVEGSLVAEIVDGDLYTSSRPATPHALAASILGGEIMGPFHRGRGGPGGWWILDEPELHLGADVLVPDLAGWRRERVPRFPRVAAVEVAPDWVCEVVSPETARLDRSRKLPLYAREKVQHAWIIDPIARTIEVLRREGTGWFLAGTHGGDDRARLEPFDAIEIEVGALWGDPGAPSP